MPIIEGLQFSHIYNYNFKMENLEIYVTSPYTFFANNLLNNFQVCFMSTCNSKLKSKSLSYRWHRKFRIMEDRPYSLTQIGSKSHQNPRQKVIENRNKNVKDYSSTYTLVVALWWFIILKTYLRREFLWTFLCPLNKPC